MRSRALILACGVLIAVQASPGIGKQTAGQAAAKETPRDGQRDFDRHERLADALTRRDAPTALLQRMADVAPGRLKRRDNPEQQARQDGHAGGKEQDAAVDRDLTRARQIRRRGRQQGAQPEPRQAHAGDAAEPVIVSTIYSAKGLEYPHVIACGLAPLGGPASAVRTLAARKLAYVGFTRAINRLTVIARTGTEFTGDLLHATDW